MAADGPSRRSRWGGLVAVSAVRLWKRTTATRSGRLAATVVAVGLTIALLVVVTGIALGLADDGTVDRDDADVRVAPAERTSLATVDGVEAPRLGETNERAARIADGDGVDHASPVLAEPVELEAADGEPRRILLVGVVPDDQSRTVAGLPTDGLEPGDEHYANGSYDGPRNGQLVLSTAAADRLEVDEGDDVAVGDRQLPGDVPQPSASVAAVEDAGDDGTPVALVHLSELQSLSGADRGALAGQVLVWGDADAAAGAADEVYPDAETASTDRTNPSMLFDDGLAFATSLLALVVGVAICASFVATTTGMTVNEERRTLAVLASVGFPARSRLALVAVSTLSTTLAGAVLGLVLGVAGIVILNAVATATVAPGAVAQLHPAFVPYAVVVALLAALVAIPYPLVVAARTSVLEEVGR